VPHAWSPEFIEARRQSVSLPHDYTQDLAQIQAPEITDAADDVAGSMGVPDDTSECTEPQPPQNCLVASPTPSAIAR